METYIVAPIVVPYPDNRHYTVIDFNEEDIRIYLPIHRFLSARKSDFHQGHKAEVKITFKGT